jgi:hypothetical protein
LSANKREAQFYLYYCRDDRNEEDPRNGKEPRKRIFQIATDTKRGLIPLASPKLLNSPSSSSSSRHL